MSLRSRFGGCTVASRLGLVVATTLLSACGRPAPRFCEVDALGRRSNEEIATACAGRAPTHLDISGSRGISWDVFSMIDVSQLQSLIANFCDLSDGDVQAAIDSMPLITGMNLGLSPLTEDKSSVIVRCARLTVLTATFTQIQGVVLEDALALDREYVLFQGGVVAGDRQELVIRGSVSLRLQLAYMSLGNVRRIVVDPGARVGVMELLELSHGESGAVVLVVLPGATIGQVTLDDSVTIDSASQSVLSSQGTVIHRM